MLQHRVVQSWQRLRFLFFRLSRELVCVGQGQCPHLTGHGGLELTPTCPHSLLASPPIPWPHLGGGFPALRKLGFVPCAGLKLRAGKLPDPDDGEQVGALVEGDALSQHGAAFAPGVLHLPLDELSWLEAGICVQGVVSRDLCPSRLSSCRITGWTVDATCSSQLLAATGARSGWPLGGQTLFGGG